jgi:NAD(P)H-hydrate repair Nnr-like enzyme with NAD(P)H-hydrate dehydratase domain
MQIILYGVECTRGAGEKVRELMEEAIIRNNQTVVLDFDGITGITQSFSKTSKSLKIVF